ncbi:thiol reductant ABC exporter subunit CydC [Georgenia alba]|uniref:Thiol reductant ABC exporter subunit CydC n=1 Tax=Georgenia alba TaxID=2233858 RepID=A0ABW2Q2U1_9MICO
MSDDVSSSPRGPLDPRLLRAARPARRPLTGLVTLAVLQACATVGVALAATDLVVALVDGEAWLGPLVALGGALLVRAAAQAATPLAAHRVSTAVVEAARRRGLAAVARRGHAAPARATDPATLLSTGLEPLRPWFARYLPALVVAAVLPAAVVLLLLRIDPASAVTVLLTLPLVPLFAALVGWATGRRAAEQYHLGGALAGQFLDVVRGLVTLKLVGRADRQVEEVRSASRRYARATTRVLSVAFLSSTALDLVATVSVGLVAVGAGVRLAGGEMDLWPALAVILLAPEAYRPLREAGAQFHESAQATAVMDRLDELDVSAPDRPTPADDADDADGGAAAGPGVVLRDAAVHHPGRHGELRLPDLSVAAGELVVVVGPSGAGKSTLLRVIAGAERITRGTVRAPRCELVPQRPALPLARTVREAFTAGAAVPDERALRVLDDLGVVLPAGLDTPLGDGAAGVSTGQRQRIAVARAVLQSRAALAAPGTPPVLLLDEPTAHLDQPAERAVVTILRDLADAGAAVVVATHRPGLVTAADRTVAVEQARPDLRPAAAHAPAVPAAGAPPEAPDGLLAGLHRRWSRLTPRARLGLAAVAGTLAGISGVGLTVAASWMIVRAAGQPPILTLSIAVVCVRAFAVARPLWRYLERLAGHDGGLARLADWRARVVADLVPQVPGRLTARRGALLTRVVEDVDARLDGQVRGAVPAAAAFGTLAIVALALAWWHAPALVPLAAALLTTAGLTRAVVRRDRRLAEARDVARTDLRDAVVAAVESPEELATAQGESMLRATTARAGVASRLEGRASRLDGLLEGGGGVAGTMLVVGGAVVAALAHATAPPETVGVLVLGSLALTETLAGLAPALRAAAAGRAARGRLADLAERDEPSRPAWHADARPLAPASATLTPAGLDVQRLAVGWEGRTVRTGVDLRVGPGQVAEIGWPSGAGKSTLAATLAGLVPHHGGTFGIDGVPAELLGPDGLRRRVALAGDADHIFATTLRENLRLARPEASDADLVAALERAYLGDWFRGLLDGLDTWFDSGGHALSGGERRRLVLARALLRDPDVLVLDEPEAGLDRTTAEALLHDLREDARSRGQVLLLLRHPVRTPDRVPLPVGFWRTAHEERCTTR